MNDEPVKRYTNRIIACAGVEPCDRYARKPTVTGCSTLIMTVSFLLYVKRSTLWRKRSTT